MLMAAPSGRTSNNFSRARRPGNYLGLDEVMVY